MGLDETGLTRVIRAGYRLLDLVTFFTVGPKEAHAWTMHPAGTEGFEKAEVTCGGIDTDELSAKTMESRKVPGLYFIGEVVDVTGEPHVPVHHDD